MDWAKVDELIASKHISVRKHPSADLFIYNYTQRTQWDNLWTPETKACRGLITDGARRIVARPFEKFFNVEQHETLPAEPFDVYEKLDGSLGVLYHVGGKPQIATRGAFESPQAREANRILAEKFPHLEFNPTLTYLFEVIYPDNRIVVNYGDRRELVLLAIIETATGCELPLPTEDVGLPVVRRHDGADLESLRALNLENQEGFVIRFKSGLRVKLKFADYKRLHKLLTGINERHIWEHLRAGTFDAMLDRTPDEFMGWARGVEADLRAKYAAIVNRCEADFRDLGDRRQTAAYFKTCQHPSVLFSMLDQKPYADTVWRMVEPAVTRTFKVAEE